MIWVFKSEDESRRVNTAGPGARTGAQWGQKLWRRLFAGRGVAGLGILVALLMGLSLVVLAAGCGDDDDGASRAGGQPATAAGSPNTITVTGKGTVTSAPDEAVLTLTVETDAPEPGASMDANSQTTRKVMERLKAEGVEDAAIETSNVSVYPVRTYDPQTGKETLTGYRTQNTVTVTLKDAATVGKVLAASVETGVTNVSGLVWRLSEDSVAVTEALKKAVANARGKAEALAGAQGVKVGDVVTMSEGIVEQPIIPIYADVAAQREGGVAEPPISPATLDITATVMVTYALAR